MSADDEALMEAAIAQARLAEQAGDVPIGAVVARGGEIDRRRSAGEPIGPLGGWRGSSGFCTARPTRRPGRWRRSTESARTSG